MRDYHLHSKNDIWTHNNCTDDSSGSNKMLKLIATLSYQLGLKSNSFYCQIQLLRYKTVVLFHQFYKCSIYIFQISTSLKANATFLL